MLLALTFGGIASVLSGLGTAFCACIIAGAKINAKTINNPKYFIYFISKFIIRGKSPT